jgi:hypothetical protein
MPIGVSSPVRPIQNAPHFVVNVGSFREVSKAAAYQELLQPFCNHLGTNQRRKHIPIAKHMQDQSIIGILRRSRWFKAVDLK